MKKPPGRRLTMLVVLVLFVFVVLLVSIIVAGMFLYLMNIFGLMQPITSNRLPFLLTFLLTVSLIVGVTVTTLVGNVSLRPLKKFIDATKEIAAGNFDVRVETRGPYEFTRLTTSFNDMARELGSIETLRDDFVSNISHEFKTPVNSIKGFVKLLKKGNITEEQRIEYLDVILMESERLTQLSKNVLLLSKLNSTDRIADTEVIRLDEQLRRVILLLDQQMEKKNIELVAELEPCSIESNGEMLQQVWINLMNNAIKFTPRGGEISLRLSCQEEQTVVTVGDTGIGMTPEVATHAFDKFYQGDRSHASEGNGLGLSLVNRIVELCGGSVSVSSQVGEGTEFTVILPKHGPYMESPGNNKKPVVR